MAFLFFILLLNGLFLFTYQLKNLELDIYIVNFSLKDPSLILQKKKNVQNKATGSAECGYIMCECVIIPTPQSMIYKIKGKRKIYKSNEKRTTSADYF